MGKVFYTGRHNGSANALPRGDSLCLPATNGLREPGPPIGGDHVEQGETAAAGVDAFSVEVQADAMISQNAEGLEKVGHLFAWEVSCVG